MRKHLTIAVLSCFISVSSMAVEPIIGLKLGHGTLSADKTDSAGKYTSKSADADSPFGAIFIEAGNIATIPNTDATVSLGLEYVPLKATIDVDATNIDARGEIKDHTTIYALVGKPVNAGKIYGRIGYSQADIGALKRNGIARTLSAQDSKLQGYTLGIGFEKEIEIPFVNASLVRLEANYTDYDKVSVTSTRSAGSISQIHSADADTTTFTVSLAKKF